MSILDPNARIDYPDKSWLIGQTSMTNLLIALQSQLVPKFLYNRHNFNPSIRDYLYSDSNYKTLINLTIFCAGGFSQPMDAAQMFKAFFGNGNGAGMHHAFHHHFGFGSNNASNMPGGAFFQFT